MAKQIITSNPTEKKVFQKDGDRFLRIAEFFYDTIQGEGINIGQPSAFLRLQGCTQSCSFCDTVQVWKVGNPYTYEELYQLMKKTNIFNQFERGQHLVFTGGSPLLQQDKIVGFINHLITHNEFIPYMEIENECVIMPSEDMEDWIDCWNNSPKLTSSGNPFEQRYKPEVIKTVASFANSWFKFVVSCDDDWEEIENGFLMPGLIDIGQIILMPLGGTREELFRNRERVIELAIENGVRYATREHIVVWDKQTGI